MLSIGHCRTRAVAIGRMMAFMRNHGHAFTYPEGVARLLVQTQGLKRMFDRSRLATPKSTSATSASSALPGPAPRAFSLRLRRITHSRIT